MTEYYRIHQHDASKKNPFLEDDEAYETRDTWLYQQYLTEIENIPSIVDAHSEFFNVEQLMQVTTVDDEKLNCQHTEYWSEEADDENGFARQSEQNTFFKVITDAFSLISPPTTS